MTVQELIDKFSERILDQNNPKEQEKALSEVIVILLNELNTLASKKFIKRKKDIKAAIEVTDNKYVEFVKEINKIANKDVLREDGFRMVTNEKFKLFL